MKLGRYLRDLRMNQNLSMDEISKKIGISIVTYCHLENSSADFDPSFKTIAKISSYTGLSAEDIRRML